MAVSEKKRILIIEDDEHIAEGVKLNLAFLGYDVKICLDGESGLREWKEWQPHLILLDIMLPVVDGIAVLKTIRKKDERLPILILSAKNGVSDKVRGLSFGVDDYIAKPFSLEELLLRIDRLLKKADWYRSKKEPEKINKPEDRFTFGANVIDFSTLTATGPEGQISLTELEVKLLKLFIDNQGIPLSRGTLLESVWGYIRKTSTRTVDNFLVRFRKYFEKDPKKPEFFKSVRSVGYVFAPERKHSEKS